MSLDFELQRFDEDGSAVPKHPRVLEDILMAVRDAFPPDDDRYNIRKRGRKSLELQLAAGLGTVRAAHAAFNVHDLDEDGDLQVIHTIARAGDMVIIAEDGRPILTHPEQRAHLPEDLVRAGERVPVAADWKELADLLRAAMGPALAYRQKVVRAYESQGVVHGVPWTTGDRGNRVVYVQALPKERYSRQSGKAFKFYSEEFVSKGIGLPTGGGMGGFSWSVRIPSGETFYGYTTRGDHAAWLGVFKAFAASGGRRIGTIEHGGSGSERFVIDDGRSVPLSSCDLRQLADYD